MCRRTNRLPYLRLQIAGTATAPVSRLGRKVAVVIAPKFAIAEKNGQADLNRAGRRGVPLSDVMLVAKLSGVVSRMTMQTATTFAVIAGSQNDERFKQRSQSIDRRTRTNRGGAELSYWLR